VTWTADGHGDCVARIKARRTISPKEIHCEIVARREGRLRYRVSEGNNLAKIGPHRRWARTECAIRILQLADIHPECGGTLAREGYLKRLANRKNARFSQVILTEKGRNLYHSMFARFCQVNKQLLRDLSEDQVQYLCTAISILRNTATQLNSSSPISTPINSK
jgi:hypothetical protein